MPASRPRRAPSANPFDQHTEWLGLLDPDGPFLAADVLTETFSEGLPTVDTDLRRRLREGWREVEADGTGMLVPGWIDLVLDELLGWEAKYRVRPDTEGGGAVPEFALTGPPGRAERVHFHRLPFGTDPARSRDGRPSPLEEAAARCRQSQVPLAMVTDGQYWALVHAEPGAPTSVGMFDADLWGEEPLLLLAFAALLGHPRAQLPALKNGEPTDSTAALFARTLDKQSKLTSDLGEQVRAAVELLVAEIARLDRESSGRFLEHVGEREIYKGALTVLMRMVFLLYAEEQRLLPTDDLYADHYSVSRLHDQLGDQRSRLGEEVADRRAAAWPRLLALFNGIHGGVEHPDLRLPAYGGSLFDPERYPWLEGFTIADRVVFEILDALVMLKPKRKNGTPTRISYKGLGVEDIGHIYEGLLEFSVRKTQGPYLGLQGKKEPEVPLAEVERAHSEGEQAFIDWLRTETGASSSKQIEKMLARSPEPQQRSLLHSAWDNDGDLTERSLPYWGLLRTDLRGEPTVFPDRSVLFTQVGERRDTGTHYTPRDLAEKVVRHTLEPLVYAPGPAEGAPEDQWRVKPAEELLKLKVCDPAMGSGAFLVAATRFLADRLVQAWTRDGLPEEFGEPAGDGHGPQADTASTPVLSPGREDLRLYAKRKVAASCIYGVDRDDMAVELAKLSLWLETLARNKPFSFLDHALRCGDSLVGLVSEEQVRAFHTDPQQGRWINARWSGDVGSYIDRVLGEATELRRKIEDAPPVDDPEDVARKARLLGRAEERVSQLRLACDAVVAAALGAERYAELDLDLSEFGERFQDAEDKSYNWQEAYDRLLSFVSDEIRDLLDEDRYDFYKEEATRSKVRDWLTGTRDEPIRPLHWALEFPEVMGDGGFDAVVGNPPFIGGQKLTGTIGRDVREYLVVDIAGGKRGSADLCSYFLLRNLDLAPKGRTGIIAINTIAQGDTREVGLDQVEAYGWTVFRAVKSQEWTGTANVHVSLVWAGHAGEHEQPYLADSPVRGITPFLEPWSRVTGNPWNLVANMGQSFQGSNVLGEGFVLTPEKAQELIEQNPKNREVLFPYLIGKDLNSRPDCSPSRWVINFGSMTEEEAREYPGPFEVVEREVKPVRARNSNRQRREIWWQFTRPAPELYESISGMNRVLVIARVSDTAVPVFSPTDIVFNEKIVVFPYADYGSLALIGSGVHEAWARRYSSTRTSDLQYTPSQCFINFPTVGPTEDMSISARAFSEFRLHLMKSQSIGLTQLYGKMHDPYMQGDGELDRLRELHSDVDASVLEAYGWGDVDLQSGFHETPKGVRWTMHSAARVKILDRLLELNFERHQKEIEDGIWPPKKKTSKKKPAAKKRSNVSAEQSALFEG